MHRDLDIVHRDLDIVHRDPDIVHRDLAENRNMNLSIFGDRSLFTCDLIFWLILSPLVLIRNLDSWYEIRCLPAAGSQQTENAHIAQRLIP